MMNQMEIKRKQIIMLMYIPGVICLLWMSGKIGNSGTGYLVAAMMRCLFFAVPLFWGLAAAAEKLIRLRMSKGQYKNAGRIRKCVLGYAALTGILAVGILYLTAELWMKRVLELPFGVLAVEMFAPAVFLMALTAALRGYFQGMGSGMPTAVSMGIQVIFSIVFGVLICNKMTGYGEKAAALLQNPDVAAMYGSAGVALGITIGILCGVVFLLLLYFVTDKRARQKNKEGMKMTEDYPAAIRILFLSLAPYLLAGFLLELPVFTGVFSYSREQTDLTAGIKAFGTFGGICMLWVFLAFLLIGAGSLTLTGKILSHMKKEEYKQGKDCFQAGLLWNMIVSAFVAAFYVGVGPSLMNIFSRNEGETSGMLLRVSGVLIIGIVLAAFFIRLLWENGRYRQVFLALACGCVCAIIVTILCLKLTKGDVISLAIGSAVQALVTMLAGGFMTFRRLHMNVDWTRTVLFPVLSALVSGIIMLVLGKVLIPVVGDFVGVLICLIIGIVSHLILVLVLKCGRERDLALMPGGRLLIKFGKTLHLL